VPKILDYFSLGSECPSVHCTRTYYNVKKTNKNYLIRN